MTISHLLSVHSVQEQVREIVVVCVFCSINGRTRRRSRWMRLIQHNLVLLWLGRGSAANYWACKERNKYTLPFTNIQYLLPIYNTFYQYAISSTNLQYLLLWLLKGVQPNTRLVKKQTNIYNSPSTDCEVNPLPIKLDWSMLV